MERKTEEKIEKTHEKTSLKYLANQIKNLTMKLYTTCSITKPIIFKTILNILIQNLFVKTGLINSCLIPVKFDRKPKGYLQRFELLHLAKNSLGNAFLSGYKYELLPLTNIKLAANYILKKPKNIHLIYLHKSKSSKEKPTEVSRIKNEQIGTKKIRQELIRIEHCFIRTRLRRIYYSFTSDRTEVSDFPLQPGGPR